MNAKTRGVLIGMILLTIVLGAAAAVFFYLYINRQVGWALPTGITFLTFFYHFAMRLMVGELITVLFRNREFPKERLGFRIHPFEQKLYRILKVRKWKANMLTAKPEQFDLSIVTPEELLHNVMQAELVHRWIMLLSFVPILFMIPFGEPLVFILTSVAACLIDSIFVIMQRFNRPRVIKYIQFQKRRR